MNPAIVLDIFNTTSGLVAIFVFPEGSYPKIGTRLERSDEATWRIIGSGMGKLSDMTNAYTHLDPPQWVYDCLLESENHDKKLAAGDNLFIL